MESIRGYLPYAVGIARWVIFLCLKAVPAMFYHPYTSRTLQRDVKRHEMLMKRGWYLRFRTGTLSGLGGGLIGLALANLIAWLIDEAAYHRVGTVEKIVQSLVIGFIPGFFVVFSFAVIIESINIRVRRKFMRDIRVHHGCDGGSIEDDLDCLIEPVLFTPSDVTVVVPVYQPPPSFKANMASLIQNGPAKIFIVADITCERKIHDIVDTLNCGHDLVEVLPEPRPGKRAALSTGLKVVQTRLTCFVDDDCQWCSDNFLEQLIKPFNNRTIGAVGSKQIMRPSEVAPKEEGGNPIFRKAKILEIMADFRLSVRYIDLMATTAVDRGASCVSGRTMCFRTEAIAEDAFHRAFMNETLLGVHLLSGDDKFLTRYIINKGYKTYHQLQRCVLTTTFESRPKKHLSQLVRWSRNTWRSDIIALYIERMIWLHNPFTAFLLFDKLFTPFFLFYGFILIPIYSLMRMDWFIFVGWIVWLHFSRFLKLVLHFKRVPVHIIYLPIWIVYQYLMALVRIYALFTMLQTQWGNRDVKVVHNEVMRTGKFSLQVMRMGQVADQERGDDEQGKDDDDDEVWDKEDEEVGGGEDGAQEMVAGLWKDRLAITLQVMRMGQVADQERGDDEQGKDDDDDEVWDKEDEEVGGGEDGAQEMVAGLWKDRLAIYDYTGADAEVDPDDDDGW